MVRLPVIEKKGPLVTLALFSYNQEGFVRLAVEGALNQDYENLEIILSDDCSPDSTFDIIQRMTKEYTGPHRVLVNRNEKNLGLASHINRVFALAKGEIIVVASGDDISLPNRVSNSVCLFQSHPSAVSVHFSDVLIDRDGSRLPDGGRMRRKKRAGRINLRDFLSERRSAASGASRAIRKSVYDFFGELNDECPTEDSTYFLRGLMLGDAVVSSEPGVQYRVHENSLSAPGSINFMKFDQIKAQYIRDANVAFFSGKIDQHMNSKVLEWVDRNYRERLLLSKLYQSSSKAKFLFFDVIIGAGVSFLTKLRILKFYVFHRR